MTRLWIMALALLAIAAFVLTINEGDQRQRVAVRASEIVVVDGDTIRLSGQRIRLVGYDAPEVVSPGCAYERQLGRAATAALARKIAAAGSIELATFSDPDRWGRGLAVMYLDGNDLADAMVAGGFGRRYHGGQRAGWC